MPPRNPVPRCWLMTDERMGDGLWMALRRLSPGSGVVFRHHATPRRERHAIFIRLRRVARARGLLVVVAGLQVGRADGVHGAARTHGLRTWPAHDRGQTLAGMRAGADLLFVSPVFATRSHEGRAGIGSAKALRIARGARTIALGGMTAKQFARLRRYGFYGWAAIDAWTRPPR